MIYFTLPDFYERFKINQFLINLNKKYNYFFKEKVCFLYVSGNFPYNYWNGEINRNDGPGAYFKEIQNCYQNYMVPLRFNFDNIFLIEEDFLNCYGNQILKINENGSNVIEISNLNFLEYIKNKYPKYNFIFSKNNFQIIGTNIEQLNFLIDTNKFILIKLPELFSNDFNYLNQIKNKKIIEIIVNPSCNQNCKYFNICFEEEQKNIYNFSKNSLIKKCDILKNNNTLITLENIKNNYLPLGINNFCFNSLLYLSDKELFNFYLKYFIKEEYQKEVTKIWINK